MVMSLAFQKHTSPERRERASTVPSWRGRSPVLMESLRWSQIVPGWKSGMDRRCRLCGRALERPGCRAGWAVEPRRDTGEAEEWWGHRLAQRCSWAFLLALEILLWQLPDMEETWRDVPNLHLHPDKGPKGRRELFPLSFCPAWINTFCPAWISAFTNPQTLAFHRIGVLQSILKT